MTELDWETLRATWTTYGPASAGPRAAEADHSVLHAMVARHRRRLIATVIGEIAMAILFAALSWLVVQDGIASWEGVWLTTLWAFFAIAAAFAWWNRRGTWRSLGDSVAEHIRLTKLRAQRQRRSVQFGIVLFVAEAIAIVAQLAAFARLTSMTFALLAAGAAAVGVCCLVTKRRIERELRAIAEFEMT